MNKYEDAIQAAQKKNVYDKVLILPKPLKEIFSEKPETAKRSDEINREYDQMRIAAANMSLAKTR